MRQSNLSSSRPGTLRVRNKVTMCFVALFLSIGSTAYGIPILSVDPLSSSVLIGTTFDVGISVGLSDPGESDDVSDLFAYQFSLSYDPSVVSVGSVTEGTFLSSAGSTLFLPGFIDNTSGVITFIANVLVGPVSGASGSGTLASIQFVAVSAGASPLSILFTTIDGDGLFDSSFNLIDSTSIDGGVTVDAVPAPAPAPVPEPASLLLVGTGVTAICARARSQQRRARTS